MSISSNIALLAARVALEIKAVRNEISLISGGSQQVFVQPTPPSVAPGTPFIWWQTGLGDSGNDLTLWVDDGL